MGKREHKSLGPTAERHQNDQDYKFHIITMIGSSAVC